MKKLDKSFYNIDALDLAKKLIGKYIVRNINSNYIIAKITETECYKGDNFDKACHAYKSKRTKRTESLFLSGGHLYIHLIYGMYYCMNIVADKEEVPSGVLIRNIEIVKGLDIACNLRYNKDYIYLTKYQKDNLSNGPGKVCKCLNIDMNLNQKDLYSKNDIFLIDNLYNKVSVIIIVLK